MKVINDLGLFSCFPLPLTSVDILYPNHRQKWLNIVYGDTTSITVPISIMSLMNPVIEGNDLYFYSINWNKLCNALLSWLSFLLVDMNILMSWGPNRPMILCIRGPINNVKLWGKHALSRDPSSPSFRQAVSRKPFWTSKNFYECFLILTFCG